MKLILHLKQLSLGHYILFLGDKWTGCATEEFSTKEMRQCKQTRCKPPTAYLSSISALLSPAAQTNGKSLYFPNLKQSKQELFPFSHMSIIWDCRPPGYGKSRVHCWVGTGSSINACLGYIRASKIELWVLRLWLPDTVQSKQAW